MNVHISKDMYRLFYHSLHLEFSTELREITYTLLHTIFLTDYPQMFFTICFLGIALHYSYCVSHCCHTKSFLFIVFLYVQELLPWHVNVVCRRV